MEKEPFGEKLRASPGKHLRMITELPLAVVLRSAEARVAACASSTPANVFRQGLEMLTALKGILRFV